MNSFLIRVVSAVAAVLAIIFLWWMWQANGLKALVTVSVLLAALELNVLLFENVKSRTSKFLFYFFVITTFVVSAFAIFPAGVAFASLFLVYSLLTLLIQGKFSNLDDLVDFQAKSVLGFFYVGLLPSFALQLLNFENGIEWFFTLLFVVSLGDTGAYITGMALGKTKLMPLVSPKKTIEGSLGGLLASGIGGWVCARYVEQSIFPMIVLAVACGVVAQFGDLFESLLKRVADKKDSGSLMPGHGGVLDRIDGVLFASPVMFLGAYALSQKPFSLF